MNLNWIPTSKRYPNKAGEYLVTVINQNGGKDVGILNFRLEGRERRPTFYNPYRADRENVTAWMKIPFPYDSELHDKPMRKSGRHD